MQHKFLLLVGDDETNLLSLVHKDEIKEMCINFDRSPSIGVLIEHPSATAESLANSAREKSIKVGVYGDFDKGVSWLHKVLDIQE